MTQFQEDFWVWLRGVVPVYRRVLKYATVIGWPIPVAYVVAAYFYDTFLPPAEFALVAWMVWFVVVFLPLGRGLEGEADDE